ncbi:hypothetical protein ACREYJ_26040 [Pseudomonas kribbensis]|uniref:hypothetical protein n=1 Tax=Pseudomonas kribbensis TaxID=1628086 RepID=UPI003D777071
MKLKLVTGALVCLALMGTAHAAEISCPTTSVSDTSGGETLKPTAARIKDGEKFICQHDGKNDLGATTVVESNTPIKPTGKNWKNDECTITDNNPKTCSVGL